MGFGPNSQEKQTMGNVSTAAQTQADLGNLASGRGGKLFKQGEKALAGPLNYWQSILSGDPVAMSGAAAPTTQAITEQYDTVEKGLSSLPRGESGSARATLEAKKAGDVSGVVERLQPTAASNLEQITAMLLGESTGETGQALTGAAGSAQTNLNLLQAQQQFQQMTAQLWAGIGEGVGSLAGGFLGGPLAAKIL